MMRRRLLFAALLLGVLLVLVAAPPPIHAQQPAKAVRIGWLLTGSPESMESFTGAFRDALAQTGLIEGKGLVLDMRYAGGDPEKFDAIALELVRTSPDLIFTGGDQGAAAVRRATKTIPFVAVTCAALAAGLVGNLARPGENLTGVTCINADLAAKRVELLREVRPGLARLGVMLNLADRRMAAELAEVERAARASSIATRTLAVAAGWDIEPAFLDAAAAELSAVVVVFDTVTFTRRSGLADLARRHGMATIFNFREYVDAGGLMSYGPNLADMYRQSVRHVVKILKGEKAGDIPMEQPTKFELVINLKTAKTLGLTIPPLMLARAGEVIE